MMMSMYSAVSGLKSQQTKLNVIGNNIANINTVGYKSQKVGFSDLLSQNISSASGASGNMGGTNAKQIGLGTQVSSIGMVMSPGSSQYTGNDTDVALGGEGFFIVQSSNSDKDYKYTRAGNFGVDTKGNLVVNGMKVCGYEPGTKGPLTALNIFGANKEKYNLGQKVTTAASLMGNLDSSKSTTASPTEVTSTMTVYDEDGVSHEVTLTFKNNPVPSQDWTVSGVVDGTTAISIGGAATSTVKFDTKGVMTDPTSGELDLTIPVTIGTASVSQAVKVSVSGIAGSASSTGTSSVRVADIDGYGSGTLTDFSIGADGIITGSYSNGQKKSLGQLVVATFNNSAGLEKVGDNLYDRTMNSGEPNPEIPGSGQAAKLTTGALEMSNVDLANEFSEMMITQRAYQANSKIITTSDTLMETLINMSR